MPRALPDICGHCDNFRQFDHETEAKHRGPDGETIDFGRGSTRVSFCGHKRVPHPMSGTGLVVERDTDPRTRNCPLEFEDMVAMGGMEVGGNRRLAARGTSSLSGGQLIGNDGMPTLQEFKQFTHAFNETIAKPFLARRRVIDQKLAQQRNRLKD